MTTTARTTFPDVRSQIAGVSVTEIARQFGTPTFVYDAAIVRERIDDLRAFDTIRYAQKANSNLAVLDLVRRQGVLVDAVSAGEVEQGNGGWICAARRPAADRLYIGHLRPRGARPGRRQGNPRQLRLARYDRPVRRACARP